MGLPEVGLFESISHREVPPQSLCITRSSAALRAADLDWIVGPEYSSGRYILGYSQRFASCLRHSAWTDILFRSFVVLFLDDIVLFQDYIVLSPYFVAFSLTFCLFFVLLTYFLLTFPFLIVLFPHFFHIFSLFSRILCKIKNIFLKNSKRTFSCYNV